MKASKLSKIAPAHRGETYRKGELELILTLAPTRENIERLSSSLGRSASAIEIVYRIAYRPGEPFGKLAAIQRRKIASAKARLGFATFLADTNK